MRLMTLEEQCNLLKTIAAKLNGASIVSVDEICYGSLESSERAGREYRYICDILKAVPKDVVDDYNQSLRKVQADKLRKKADEIERG